MALESSPASFTESICCTNLATLDKGIHATRKADALVGVHLGCLAVVPIF